MIDGVQNFYGLKRLGCVLGTNIRNTGHYSRIFAHHLNSNACVLVLLREDTKKSILRESYCQLGLSSTSNKPKMVNARYCASWFVFCTP